MVYSDDLDSIQNLHAAPEDDFDLFQPFLSKLAMNLAEIHSLLSQKQAILVTFTEIS